MYILQYINLNFQKLFWEVNILYAIFVKYALINFRSPNQYTISIDLLTIRISIRITSIRISKQSKHRDQQAKGQRESALSCIKKYALCCIYKLVIYAYFSHVYTDQLFMLLQPWLSYFILAIYAYFTHEYTDELFMLNLVVIIQMSYL